MVKYSKQWRVAEPGLLIFLIDQSESMGELWEDKTRAERTALVINRTITNIICMNMSGKKPKERAYIVLIGYGGKGDNSVDILNKGLLPDYANNPIRTDTNKQKIPDGNGGFLEVDVDTPVWIDPVAVGLTPMAGAFKTARALIEKWIKEKNPEGPASVIINITDGVAYNGNEADPYEELRNTIEAFKNIQKLETKEKESPLVFNIHIGGNNTKISFPEEESEVGNDEMAKFLFQISSVIPDTMKNEAKKQNLNVKQNSRAFIANADVVDLVAFVGFGSSQAKDKIV
jgi:hypothetical protein